MDCLIFKKGNDPPPIPQRLAKVLLLLLEQPGERLVAVLLAVAEAAWLPPRLRMRRPRVPLLVLRWAGVEHALGGGGREDTELLLLLLLLRLQLAAQTSARFGARTAARVRRGGCTVGFRLTRGALGLRSLLVARGGRARGCDRRLLRGGRDELFEAVDA